MPRGDAALARLAARNNAEWCRTVAESHGIASRFALDGALWVAESSTPIGYPEAVTLEPGLDAAAVFGALGPHATSVKDSFADLDPDATGWAPLFDATWIVAEAIAGGSAGADDLPALVRVTSADALETWGRAHGLPDALAEPLVGASDVVVLATARAETSTSVPGAVTGGGVLNRTGEVVGLSNVFGGGHALYRALRREAAARWPGLPVVGYESDAALDDALDADFRRVGPLRILTRATQPDRQTA
ncbi:hypothetical protein MUN74_05810 [Agromyces endophyticus]|uniref:hypothetical protein n=1 Tax=Agromyces sp. H17E-10 TaxID=2932244 RepID=UPI001FD3A81F|nr:hypothetical protein [Agromyces sp. H17E-10]UOQ90432.1 hypothetical protein MUN74_05810 [Agromyces sp. H17E-10]